MRNTLRNALRLFRFDQQITSEDYLAAPQACLRDATMHAFWSLPANYQPCLWRAWVHSKEPLFHFQNKITCLLDSASLPRAESGQHRAGVTRPLVGFF
jgi:hypothetical protein